MGGAGDRWPVSRSESDSPQGSLCLVPVRRSESWSPVGVRLAACLPGRAARRRRGCRCCSAAGSGAAPARTGSPEPSQMTASATYDRPSPTELETWLVTIVGACGCLPTWQVRSQLKAPLKSTMSWNTSYRFLGFVPRTCNSRPTPTVSHHAYRHASSGGRDGCGGRTEMTLRFMALLYMSMNTAPPLLSPAGQTPHAGPPQPASRQVRCPACCCSAAYSSR